MEDCLVLTKTVTRAIHDTTRMGISTAQAATEDDVTEQHTTSTLVCGRLSAADFALAETFTTIPDLTVEHTLVAATGTADRMALLRAQTNATDSLTATLAHDPSVSAIEELWRTTVATPTG